MKTLSFTLLYGKPPLKDFMGKKKLHPWHQNQYSQQALSLKKGVQERGMEGKKLFLKGPRSRREKFLSKKETPKDCRTLMNKSNSTENPTILKGWRGRALNGIEKEESGRSLLGLAKKGGVSRTDIRSTDDKKKGIVVDQGRGVAICPYRPPSRILKDPSKNERWKPKEDR